MAVYGRIPDPLETMRRVKPPTGFPVPNMGGIPRRPVMSPKRPVPSPSLEEGPPGPEPSPSTPEPMSVPLVAAEPAHVPEPTPAPPPPPPPAAPAGPSLTDQISAYVSKALGGGAGAYEDR